MKTAYDLWLENETAQIRAKYETEKDEIRGEAFLEGFKSDSLYDNGSKSRDVERTAKLADISQREENAVNEFMRTIDKSWDSHVESVLKQK